MAQLRFIQQFACAWPECPNTALFSLWSEKRKFLGWYCHVHGELGREIAHKMENNKQEKESCPRIGVLS